MPRYAEVILPLPLYTTFAYIVPDDMQADVAIGSRVLVQFGQKKFYTGIVAALSDRRPGDFDMKPIMSLLDSTPIVRHPQLKFWAWIADYYLSSIGDVYKAAIPTGLKPESETWLTLNPDFETPDHFRLSDRQEVIVSLLESEKKLRLSDIEKKTKISNIGAVANKLLEKGVVEIAEQVNQKYRPKTRKMVKINATPGDADKIHEFFDKVARAQKQEKLLMTYLDRSHFLSPKLPHTPVLRDELLKAADANSSILKALIDKGIFTQYTESYNRFIPKEIQDDTPIKLASLSPKQADALQKIRECFRSKNVCLLHGATGSGKTEIYSHLINAAFNDGNQVLMIVPEISLTTQLTDRLRKVFGSRLVVYHSRFSDNERVDIYKRMLASHEPLIVLGARSSVFLPFSHLGLVIVDEEHESSFKQYDPAPRFNARDAAIVLASMHGAKTLLGSASPSVETYWKALNGKYGLVGLNDRYGDLPLPRVEIVDMKAQRKKKINKGILSRPLLDTTTEALQAGRQAIMFINRRGFAPVVVCKQCGWTPKCPNCDVSPVYHKHTDSLRCHYCGFSQPLPSLCPACGENGVEVFGYGTERIAEEMSEAFPDHKISRMDLDTTRNKDSYQEIIEEFSKKETDILVGTQMVTKGLDFEKVDVVGVLNADTLLNFPDFRSNERAFNMLEQVSGRAGRREANGRVVIQTTNPDNDILKFVKNHDYDSYFNQEIEDRRQFAYPPFTRIINVYIKNKDRKSADAAAVKLAMALRQVFGNRVLGPERPFVSRIATYYLQSIMLKIETEASMKKVKYLLRSIYESLARDPLIKSSVVYYDVDPV
ncbi:MAG: primosomal protein N' [Muribaculum sp.]|nr:primosomal protein N' [Muribaculum sp.]